MCYPLPYHRPEENGRDDVGTISELVVECEAKCQCEDSDCPIYWGYTTSSESKREEPDSDIGNGCDIDPSECELDTVLESWMSITSLVKAILEESKYHEHHNECSTHPDISPWDKPDSCKCYRERKCYKNFWRYFSRLERLRKVRKILPRKLRKW